MRPGKWTGRRRIATLMVVGLVGALGVVLAWPERDSWPARLEIPGPKPGEGMAEGYSRDGRWFRTSSDAGLTSWDATTGKRGQTVPPPMIFRRTESSDGRRFVGWIGDDFGVAEVVVGDAATDSIERRFPVSSVQGTNLAFRDGDRTIEVVLGDRSGKMAIATWDLASGVESRRAIAGPGVNYSRPVAYSPDGRVWAYLDKVHDGIQLWDSRLDKAIGGLLRTPGTQRNMFGWAWTAATFFPDGRTLIMGRNDGVVEFWAVADGHLVKSIKLHPTGQTVMHLLLSPDGRSLISNSQILMSPSRIIQEWDNLRRIVTGESATEASVETVVLDLAGDKLLGRARRCQGMVISPDSRTVVCRQLDGSLSFRDIPRP